MWQKCPICNGTGEVFPVGISNGPKKCDVCNGKKIISKLTGKPPKDKDKEISKVRGDDQVHNLLKQGLLPHNEYSNIASCSNCKLAEGCKRIPQNTKLNEYRCELHEYILTQKLKDEY